VTGHLRSTAPMPHRPPGSDGDWRLRATNCLVNHTLWEFWWCINTTTVGCCLWPLPFQPQDRDHRLKTLTLMHLRYTLVLLPPERTADYRPVSVGRLLAFREFCWSGNYQRLAAKQKGRGAKWRPALCYQVAL